MSDRTIEDLRYLQALPLEMKVEMTKARICEWVAHYCMNGGAYDDNGIWKPDSKGLGMAHVIDELNKLYGEGFIKY